MKIFLFAVFVLGTLTVTTLARDLKERHYKEFQEYERKRAIISMLQTGFHLLTKGADIVDTVDNYKSRLSFTMGLLSSKPSTATKEDIDKLRDQITSIDANMKSSFAQVLTGQEFGQVLSNYNRYIHHLESVVLLGVLDSIGGNERLADSRSNELAKEIIGGMNADRTEFALLKTDEMIKGGSIFQLKSFYQAVAGKNAACSSNCQFNINDLTNLASQFNTLQSAAYGALEAAFTKSGNQEKATALHETMKQRMNEQVQMLYSAVVEFRDGAGSGPTMRRLRNARGGCLAFKDGVKFHLRDCDDSEYLLKVRVNKDRSFIIKENPDRCYSYYMTVVEGSYCRNNKWDLQISQVDPRYIIFKGQDRCLAANMGDPKEDNGEQYTAVDRAYRCASPGDGEALSAETENQFWEFI